MASSPRWYRPRGGSLVIAVVARFLWLPLLSGGAIALATGSREGGVIAGVVLLAVELSTYRWRWAWRTLEVSPAGGTLVESMDDVRRQAWAYGIGVALLSLSLAAWQDYAAAAAGKLAELAGIVVGTALVAGGHLLFEHLVRNPRWPRMRSQLGGDDVIDAPGEAGLLLLLAPRSWQVGGATVLMIAVAFLCAAMGMIVVAETSSILREAPPFIMLCMLVVAAFAPMGALIMSVIEAHHATAFVNARSKGEIESPPAA